MPLAPPVITATFPSDIPFAPANDSITTSQLLDFSKMRNHFFREHLDILPGKAVRKRSELRHDDKLLESRPRMRFLELFPDRCGAANDESALLNERFQRLPFQYHALTPQQI